MKQGRYQEALYKFELALAQKEREGNYNSHNLRIAQSYRNIGAAYYCLVNYKQALRYHEQALQIRRYTLGEDNLLTSDSYENVGVVYRALGDFSKSLEYLSRALEIRERNTYGTNGLQETKGLKLSIATSYYDIGSVYRDIGNNEEALRYHRKALQIRSNYLLDQNNPKLEESQLAVKELELKLGLTTSGYY